MNEQTLEDMKKKIFEMYELMDLDTYDITEEEIGRIASYYVREPHKLDEDLLNIKNKKEGTKRKSK